MFCCSVKPTSCRFSWISFSFRTYKAVSTDNQWQDFPKRKISPKEMLYISKKKKKFCFVLYWNSKIDISIVFTALIPVVNVIIKKICSIVQCFLQLVEHYYLFGLFILRFLDPRYLQLRILGNLHHILFWSSIKYFKNISKFIKICNKHNISQNTVRDGRKVVSAGGNKIFF